MQHRDRDAPVGLAAAMLARQFIDAPLQRLAQPEIVAAERQDRFRQHRAIKPVRQRDRHLHHAPALGAAQDLPAFDQAEAGCRLQPAGCDVGGDARARQPLERLAQPPVAVAGGFAVGRHQQVMGLQRQRARHRAACVQGRHQLADAVDQDVLVEQRGEPAHRRRHGDLHPAAGIGQHPQVGARGQAEQRVFHAGHVILGQRIEDVADKEIGRGVPVGQQPRPPCRQRLRHALPFRGFVDGKVIHRRPPRPSPHRGSGVGASGLQSRAIGVPESPLARNGVASP